MLLLTSERLNVMDTPNRSPILARMASMPTKDDVPSYHELMNPTLRALHRLGGSASIQELVEEVIVDLGIESDIADVPHGSGSTTELEYRAAWARTYLKQSGVIDNSARGVWALTSEGRDTDQINPQEVVHYVREHQRERRKQREAEIAEEEDSLESTWQDELLDTLRQIEPDAFERLCQRLLRESGFIEVEVTRRSGDGGIDGYGIIRIADLISFTVLFQSKRYKGTIGPDTVRDFRGAMVGRADKGLLITTGGFTREARREATRDGAPPIDLIDGELLIEKLKELELGVKVTTRQVQDVEVDHHWFTSL